MSFNVSVIDLEYIEAIYRFPMLLSIVHLFDVTFKYIGINTKFADFIKTVRILHRLDNS